MKPFLFCVAAFFAAISSAFAAPVAKPASTMPTTSFVRFDERAKAGERLNVVFFGASLTWGANASDPMETSYRAQIARKFEAAYPRAHFRFFDAAIGGTGSQLGVFRLERDVLRRKPDLVFLDFSANDDIYSDDAEKHASYESLVRRLVTDAKCPVVQVMFPFKFNIKPGEMQKMKRRDAHYAISRGYNTAVGDAIALVTQRVENGQNTLDELWPIDGAHPGDKGYALFAEAAWGGFQDGLARKLNCRAPLQMIHASTYMTSARARISGLGALPQGWKIGIPNRTSAWYDGLMSRWLDDASIASNRLQTLDAAGKKTLSPQTVAPLKVNFRGSMVLLFGEETLKSGKYRVLIDGKPAVNSNSAKDASPEEFNASALKMGGNRQHAQLLTTGLDPSVEHTLEIQPLFDGEIEQELRLESICVAGGATQIAVEKP